MKRALVTYSSSSSSDEREDGNEKGSQKLQITTKQVEPTAKKRKLLPKLSANLVPVIPVDDPTKHQGRIRTQPFVDGQFAVHVYVPMSVAGGTPLRTLLEDAVKDVRKLCPKLQVFSLLEIEETPAESSDSVSTTPTPSVQTTNLAPKRNAIPTLVEAESTSMDAMTTENGVRRMALVTELHLSLSRPVFARSHQREEVKRAVKKLARGANRFDASFAAFTILNNDERTRSFLTVEIGAGHSELSELSIGLEPLLKEYRQPGYYAQPRYHISIAWILTPNSNTFNGETGAGPDYIGTSYETGTISFPEDLVDRLDRKYAEALRKLVLPIESICTKIGKHVNRWDLQ